MEKKEANKQTKPMLLSFLVALTLGHVPQIDFVTFGWKRALSNVNSSLQWLPLHVILPPSLQSGVFYPNIIARVVAGLKTYKELDKDLDGQRRRLIKTKGKKDRPIAGYTVPSFCFSSSLLQVCFIWFPPFAKSFFIIYILVPLLFNRYR